MQAIILAAGAGKRLASVSKGVPKAMLSIAGKTIIQNQIEACYMVGIDHYIVVCGYKSEMLKQHVLSILPADKVTFIENPEYNKTNTLYSLYLAKKYFQKPFLYFNADVFFDPALLQKINYKIDKSQLLLRKGDCEEEEVKIIIDKNGRVMEIGKGLKSNECAGEFIGIGYFAKRDLELFGDYLMQGVEHGEENNYFEYAVDFLCKQRDLIAVSTGNIKCIEIDFPEDLQRAAGMFEE